MADPVILTRPLGKRNQQVVDTKYLMSELRKANQAEAKAVKRRLEKTVATWDEPVTFHQETKVGDRLNVIVFTTSRIFHFINEGTRIRYATMVPGYKPKTRPNVLGSFPGFGRVAFVDKSKPRPGIKARNFTRNIQRERKPLYDRRVLTILEKARARGQQ